MLVHFASPGLSIQECSQAHAASPLAWGLAAVDAPAQSHASCKTSPWSMCTDALEPARPPTRQSAGLALSLSKGDALVGFSRFSVTLSWLAERSRQRACTGEGMREPSSVS
mmetsp:Transcript_125396/g.217189  ORF Transcript_125396/g.217189 Transcript_125396/m.217189 type:complete len:111 (+) Transcript_125396:413-745(+)